MILMTKFDPSDDEILELADDSDMDRFEGARNYPDGTVTKEGYWEAWDHQLLPFARAVLSRYSTPRPVPVAVGERPWERDGWLNDEGFCWFWDSVMDRWSFRAWECNAMPEFTLSLPHDAIPTPATTEPRP